MNEGGTGPREVRIPAGKAELPGSLAMPGAALGIVVFAHGSGSGRQSPRNQFVARVIREGGLGTLLFDLLTESESVDRRNAFDIGLLSDRLHEASRWVEANVTRGALGMGLFGASTGAAAALVVAGREPSIRAVVSRGGRPDLAGASLIRVRAPTLLIVGGADREVLELNERALERLRCPRRLDIVPGATHLFEEPGALEDVSRLARDWFLTHVAPRAQA